MNMAAKKKTKCFSHFAEAGKVSLILNLEFWQKKQSLNLKHLFEEVASKPFPISLP